MRKHLNKIAVVLLLTSCSMSEVLETPLPRTKADTTYHPRQIDTLSVSDVPIGFNVNIDDWEEDENEINI